MATGSFGFTGAVTGTYAGSGYSQGVALAAVMPVKGKIIAIKLKLATYASTTHPKIWGMIWARTAGTILSQSVYSISPTNVYVNSSNLQVFTINMPETEIAAGTALWVGFAKDSSGANLAPWWGVDTSYAGYTWYEDNGSAATPQPFVVSETHASAGLYVEVVYKTGGEIKTFDGNLNALSKPVKVWNGSTWAGKPLKIWNGSAWVESNS